MIDFTFDDRGIFWFDSLAVVEFLFMERGGKKQRIGSFPMTIWNFAPKFLTGFVYSVHTTLLYLPSGIQI